MFSAHPLSKSCPLLGQVSQSFRVNPGPTLGWQSVQDVVYSGASGYLAWLASRAVRGVREQVVLAPDSGLWRVASAVLCSPTGIAVGHIYYFLEDVFPNQPGGKRLLLTPSFL